MLNFRKVGASNFEMRVKAYALKTPSVQVPLQRKKLLTFSTTGKGHKKKIQSLQQELKRVQKCMRRKIAFANKTGTSADVIGEQYIENPRAMCDSNGQLIQGHKHVATSFYKARYANQNLITHSLPSQSL